MKELFYLIALLAFAVYFVSCHSMDTALPSPDGSYRGRYTFGFEVGSLTPCGSPEQWWVTVETPVLREALGERTATVYTEVRGDLSAKGSYGHLGQYARELVVREVVLTRLPTEKDCW